MSLAADAKAKIVAQYQQKEGDTGSPEVQVALLTTRIKELTGHFKTHIHDNHSRRRLIWLVNQRRKLLRYLKGRDLQRYKTLIARLELRDTVGVHR